MNERISLPEAAFLAVFGGAAIVAAWVLGGIVVQGTIQEAERIINAF